MAMNGVGQLNQLGSALGFNGQNGVSPAAAFSNFIQRAGAGQIGAGCKASGGIANSKTPADTARLQALAQSMGFKDCGCGCKGAKALTKLLQKMKGGQQGQGGCSQCNGGMPAGWKPGLNAQSMAHNDRLTNSILGAGPRGGGGGGGAPGNGLNVQLNVSGRLV